MRFLIPAAALLCLVPRADAQPARGIERALADALRDVHDRGAELYNAGDRMAGYRMYQGGLLVARGLLTNHPGIQRTITDGLAAAEREPTVDRRAFALHELIERVRVDLKNVGKKSEAVTIPPRELKGGRTSPPKPSAGVGEVKGGVIGRVLWQGAPVSGLEVTFVTLGRQPPRVYETTSGPQGVYSVPDLPPGKYVVLIAPGPKAQLRKLPDRYATATTSPLVFDIKAGGEKLDFVLQ